MCGHYSEILFFFFISMTMMPQIDTCLTNLVLSRLLWCSAACAPAYMCLYGGGGLYGCSLLSNNHFNHKHNNTISGLMLMIL